jgi:predicted transposase YbfD/YdcC
MESTTSNSPDEEKSQQNSVIFDINSLYGFLLRIQDRRKPRGIRYNLAMILVVIILSKLCGQDTPYAIADWAQNRSEFLVEVLRLKHKRLPHHSTYRRILESCFDHNGFDRLLGEFLGQNTQTGQIVVIAIDGKTLRGTINLDDPFGLHLLTAYLPGEGLVLMQLVVEKDKENEIVVAPQLLKCLDLRDKIVVGDAMQTQRALSIQIVAAEGQYVWIVKDNQPLTHQAIELLFAPPAKPIPGQGHPPMDFRTAKTVNKGHGRLEERTITVSSLLNDYLDWPSVNQVFKLERCFTCLSTGKIHHEIQYGLTNLTPQQAGPERLLEVVRSEWGIENGLHYRRDVTFHEDHTRMTRKPMARAMAMINNLVISLLNRHGFSNHARARRVFDARPSNAFDLICGL